MRNFHFLDFARKSKNTLDCNFFKILGKEKKKKQNKKCLKFQ